MQSLKHYIESCFNNSQTAFANKQGVSKHQVTQWLKKDFIVCDVDGKIKMYSFRRELQ